jgi:N-acetyl sugar amidotransferase
MKICNRCLYSENHPLFLTFDEEGVCSGCRVHEEKDILDWPSRLEKLKSIAESYRNRSGNNYDCIIPVSGAKDSYFIVHTVKNVLKLNPLLVTYNKHYNTDLGIRNLANLRIKFNCDIMTLTVSPETVKKITRATFRKMGSIYWHCIAGQTAYPVQVAVKFKIPLIIWGAHQGVDQVGMFSHLNEVEMTRKYRKEHDLMGYEAEDLIDEFDGIVKSDIVQYMYPHDKEIERVGVRGIYLNNYLRWDSKAQHEKMIELYDYETGEQTGTFDTYNNVDCFNYSDVHDYIKFIKHGYGKITDHVCREIRLKRLSREEGIRIIKEYENRKPKNLKLFLDWIGMTENGFHFILDLHRNLKIWFRNENWDWELKNPDRFSNDEVQKEKIEKVRLKKPENSCDFKITINKRPDFRDDKYILIGKGYYN